LLFCVIRPASVFAMPWGRLLDHRQRSLVSWFGIRGIGSIYYLFYALNHGLVGTSSAVAVNLTLSVIALSILAHGLTTQPMLAWYERQAAQKN
ncbi:MAG: cation:proton antiporter, partial [Pseudomonas paracarnis]